MPILRRTILLFSMCVLCFHLCVFANEQEKTNAFQDYFKYCQKNIHLPQAEQMCDTLFQIAQETQNKRMELNAAWLKVDFYYFSGDTDKIEAQVELAKKLSKACNNPKAYYFIWGNRLITSYIIQNKMNIALYEVNKMLKEAEQEDYKPGIAECFRSFAVIYLSQGVLPLAIEYFQKEIDLYESEDIPNHNLPVEYSSLAQCAIELNRVEQAEEAIKKGKAQMDISDPYQVFTMCKASLYLYLHQKEFTKALEELQTMEKLCAENENMNQFIDSLHDAQLKYYRKTRQHDKALATIDKLSKEEPYKSTVYLSNGLNKDRGNIYRETGKFADATQAYWQYIQGNDTLTSHTMQNAISEFNTILEVELLQKDKKALWLDVQKKQLHVTYLIIAFMFTLSIVGLFFYIRIYKLNTKLKNSEAELRIAKEKAEKTSLMKSAFINNMSHEIRTPLNSIVGFSQVLSELNADKPELKEYSDIIDKGSSDLLRLIDDVLSLSSIDQEDEIPYNIPDDINNACNESINAVSSNIKPEVELAFVPSRHDLIIQTNPIKVTQILTQLLHNATKFTEHGKIELSYEIVNKQIIYSITDTGIGIPEEEQEHVFERFVKLNSFSQGTGLGLSLCRLIAEKIGGCLTIDKEYKSGCRFLLVLPFIQ